MVYTAITTMYNVIHTLYPHEVHMNWSYTIPNDNIYLKQFDISPLPVLAAEEVVILSNTVSTTVPVCVEDVQILKYLTNIPYIHNRLSGTKACSPFVSILTLHLNQIMEFQ